MTTFDSVAWFPLCAGLTGLGLVGSWLALRRRGVGAGLRGAAWSLLPLAAYLTGAVEMLWRIGTAISNWVAGFVFSPRVWSGVIVTGLAVLLYVVSGALRRRAPDGDGEARRQVDGAGQRGAGQQAAGQQAGGQQAGGQQAGGQQALDRPPAPQPAQSKGKGKGKADGDDEFAEIEEILRRRGIS